MFVSTRTVETKLELLESLKVCDQECVCVVITDVVFLKSRCNMSYAVILSHIV